MSEVRFNEVETNTGDYLHFFLLEVDNRQDIPSRLDIEIRAREPHAWCVDQFGPPSPGGWARQVGGFFFWKPEQASAFKLRWC